MPKKSIKKITFKKVLIPIVLLIVLLSFLLALTNFYLTNFAFPNIFLAHINVGGKSQAEIKKILRESYSREVDLKIKDRVYPLRYSDLGVVLDGGTTLNTIFETNKQSFTKKIKSFFNLYFSQKYIMPSLIFTQNYYDFINKNTFDFTEKEDEVAVDPETKLIGYQMNQERYRVDPENLKQRIVLNFGSSGYVYEPDLIKVADYQVQNLIISQNEKLMKVFSDPLEIVIKDDDRYNKIVVPETDLKTMIEINYDKKTLAVEFGLNDQLFNDLVATKVFKYNTPDKKIDLEEIKINLLSMVRSRFDSEHSGTIMAQLSLSPNSQGELAPKYIEVDLSQQMMYLFEKGQLAANYRISSGLYYPTPTGQFKIINKAVNAFSNIYNVWMPYWMAFAYDGKLNAYFGIHELPYWISQSGQRVSRPQDNVGAPSTGGCVSLGMGDSKKVYDFSDIDMPLYIYD